MTDWTNLAAYARTGFSQYGEEGIIAKLLDDLGVTDRYLVDIGAGDGRKLSNTRALLESGWHGALFDSAYAGDVNQERITAENVCDVLARYNVPGEFDFMSLDIDGVDWYVLRAVLRGGYRPRLFVCEINPGLEPLPAATVVYDPAFTFSNCKYFGASLGAFQMLAVAHGYKLVYVHEAINAFFVRTDALPPDLRLNVKFVTRQPWPADPQGRQWHLVTPNEVP